MNYAGFIILYSIRHWLGRGEILAFYDFISQALVEYLLRAGRLSGTLCVLDILRLDPQTDPAPAPAPAPEPGETEAGEQLHSRCHPGAGMGALWRGEILGPSGSVLGALALVRWAGEAS